MKGFDVFKILPTNNRPNPVYCMSKMFVGEFHIVKHLPAWKNYLVIQLLVTRVFAKRLKNGRAWCKKEITKFSNPMIALMDGKKVLTQRGSFQRSAYFEQNLSDKKKPKYFKERLDNHIQDMTRNNIAYLQQSVRKPVYLALKGLRGF